MAAIAPKDEMPFDQCDVALHINENGVVANEVEDNPNIPANNAGITNPDSQVKY